ncbi:hypothetical protein, partial [Streptomyces stramineus]|uniref:hypothetical protein n=1 Tax=Streptomyces stramineus TaxID=173861 RepID=UPI0031DE161F
MKLHGKFTLPLILILALVGTLWASVSSGSAEASQEMPASSAEKTSLVEKAAFELDEGAGSRRVSGGAAEEFVAQLGGGAELGVAGKSGSALRLNGASAYAATSGPVVDTTKSFSV